MSQCDLEDADITPDTRLLAMDKSGLGKGDYTLPGTNYNNVQPPKLTISISEIKVEQDIVPNCSPIHLSPSATSFTSVSTGSRSRNSISFERRSYTQPEFDEDYFGHKRQSKSFQERKTQWKEDCSCNAACLKSFIYRIFPFIKILKNYNVKEDLLSDFISGLMVGIMNIPQGMAYSILAGLEPVYGLYVSFFPVLLYFFFGTSRHIALGTFAIMSLMVAKSVDAADCSYPGDLTTESPVSTATDWGIMNSTSEPGPGAEYEALCKIGVATALTFVAGAFQLIMGLLQLGFVAIYLPEPLTRGFTTGAAFHVFTSQVSTVLGLSVERYTGAGKLILTYIDLFKVIGETIWVTVVISVICLVVLFFTKEFINPIVKKKINLPVPIELFVVIAATVASYYLQLEEKHEVDVVGDIPTGIEAPKMPPTDKMSSLIADAFAIAVVSFAISVAQSEFFAKKHGYECDNNQEMIALGICNFVPAFFNCYMTAASLSRSLVQDNTGGKTQVASLVSCVLVLVVLFFIGPLFEALPMCVLASIIIVALKNAFLQLTDLRTLWFISKVDWSIYFVTWIATVMLDIDLGLVVGVVYCLLTVIARTQKAYTCLLGQVPNTDIYRDISVYEKVEEIPGIKIFRFEASLYYANRKHFTAKLFAKSEVDPQKLNIEQLKAKKKDREIPEPPIHSVIIDCTTMGYIDSVGVSTLKTVIADYNTVDVHVSLAGCKGGVRDMLVSAKFYDKHDRNILFPAVHDAVVAAMEREYLKKNKIPQMEDIPMTEKPTDPEKGGVIVKTQL